MFVRINARVFVGSTVKDVWFTFETHHETMDEIQQALVRDGSLCGTRYETEKRGKGVRFVVDAFDCIIPERTVSSISEMRDDLYDQDGSALFLMDEGVRV